MSVGWRLPCEYDLASLTVTRLGRVPLIGGGQLRGACGSFFPVSTGPVRRPDKGSVTPPAHPKGSPLSIQPGGQDRIDPFLLHLGLDLFQRSPDIIAG